MAKKKDMFDSFLEKNFNTGHRITIAKPADTGREVSYEERKRLAEEEASRQGRADGGGDVPSDVPGDGAAVPAGEGSAAPAAEAAAETAGVGQGGGAEASAAAEDGYRRPGRPRRDDRGPVMNMNFLIEVELKQKLEKLKIDLYRSSVTDLMKEAIHDLLVKYGVEEG